ncbi:hypothetical protein GCM10007423_02600 [Dyadobacter endophyticus]|uniref:Uncharacterized protein n=1 Tax=Dyadobacter endophyticus TaxID=1749036 RepID=A0ABQ1YEE1_9BACT|nr:hypothetical protein GCM10007423_02600 [Dyadobacter endophyticus]
MGKTMRYLSIVQVCKHPSLSGPRYTASYPDSHYWNESHGTLWKGTYRGIVAEGLFTYQMRVVMPGGMKHSYRGSLISLH